MDVLQVGACVCVCARMCVCVCVSWWFTLLLAMNTYDIATILTGICGEGETVVLGGGGGSDDVTDGTGRVGGVIALA